jgi:hypothetical protein
MDDLEQQEGVRFGKQRRAFERTLADPDDLYIDVMNREEERRKQGLPSRVGVLPFTSPGIPEDEDSEPEMSGRSQNTKPSLKATASASKSLATYTLKRYPIPTVDSVLTKNTDE